MVDYAGKRSTLSNHEDEARDAGEGQPGKRTLTEKLPPIGAPVQQRGDAAAQATSEEQVHASAQRGIATSASPLPHGDRLQQLFGRHDISGVKAHVGGDAAASAKEMGAQAYASGDHVVLGQGADLHTVAHEAAHVVQQRGGVQLKGGVGASGDAYEQHADAVADAVVQGKSAESLLDRHAGGGGTSSAVQRKTSVVDDAADQKNKTAPGTGSGLLKPTTGNALPASDVKFGPLVKGSGSSVIAWRYPSDDATGSTPSVRPSWWAAMMADPSTDTAWVSNNLVQGHLLNEHLGGPGSDMRNLTPFAKSTNSQHHAKVEKKAKAIFARGNIVRYTVTADYTSAPPAAWFASKIPAQYLANFAHSIECVLDEYDPATGSSITGMEDVTHITNAVTGQG